MYNNIRSFFVDGVTHPFGYAAPRWHKKLEYVVFPLKNTPITAPWCPTLRGPELCYFRSCSNRLHALSVPVPGEIITPTQSQLWPSIVHTTYISSCNSRYILSAQKFTSSIHRDLCPRGTLANDLKHSFLY